MRSPLKEIFLSNEAATVAFGKSLAPLLQRGDILNLVGELGAGKTTLVKGMALAWGGAEEDISSPTFSLVNEYFFPQAEVLHCDFYRLDPRNELADFGGLEFFFQKKIYLIEWLEKSGLIKLINKEQIVTLEIETKFDARVVRLPEQLENSRQNYLKKNF